MTHLLRPGTKAKKLAGHGMHSVLLVVFANVPGAHGVQALRPVTFAYVPVMQPAHSLLPMLDLYLPSAH